MALQLSGTDPVDVTFASNGTRGQLVSQFETVLTSAGWTVVSGGGSSDVILESATTPAGLKIRFEAIDPGAGNCAQFKIRDNTTLVGAVVIFLLPVNLANFRIWANKYQFFYFLSGTDMTKQRALVCGGVPWVPNFIKDIIAFPYIGWMHGNGTTDASATQLAQSFRKVLIVSAITNYSAIWNNALFSSSASTNVFGLVCQSANTNLDDLWEDGTFTLFEPILCWQSSNFSSPVRHGQLWDAALNSKVLDSEVKRSFANKTWRNITHQNGLAGGIGRGSLLLVTPS